MTKSRDRFLWHHRRMSSALDSEKAADTLMEAEPRAQRQLIAKLRQERARQIFTEMPIPQQRWPHFHEQLGGGGSGGRVGRVTEPRLLRRTGL